MEHYFDISLEVEESAEEEKIRHWLENTLNGKVEYQYFIAYHAGLFSGWGTIEGLLFVRNSRAISQEEMLACLSNTSAMIKSIKVVKKV